MNSMISAFQQKYPHIKVEAVYQGGYADLHKKLQAAVAASEKLLKGLVKLSVNNNKLLRELLAHPRIQFFYNTL